MGLAVGTNPSMRIPCARRQICPGVIRLAGCWFVPPTQASQQTQSPFRKRLGRDVRSTHTPALSAGARYPHPIPAGQTRPQKKRPPGSGGLFTYRILGLWVDSIWPVRGCIPSWPGSLPGPAGQCSAWPYRGPSGLPGPRSPTMTGPQCPRFF